jgi:hypothetical protein
MITRSPYGAPLAGATLQPTLAALKATPVTDHVPYELIQLIDGRVVYYHPTCALTADELFLFAPTNILVGGVSTVQPGAYLLAPGPTVLSIAVTYAKADAAVLATVPTGAEVKLNCLLWNVTTLFNGGSTPTVGVSSGTLTGYTTKGDLLLAGTAALTATGAKYKAGTVGTVMDTPTKRDACILVATDTIRWDRIASAYTGGAGNIIILADILTNPGA